MEKTFSSNCIHSTQLYQGLKLEELSVFMVRTQLLSLLYCLNVWYSAPFPALACGAANSLESIKSHHSWSMELWGGKKQELVDNGCYLEVKS